MNTKGSNHLTTTYTEAYIAEPLSTAVTAALNYSKAYFCRMFRRVMSRLSKTFRRNTDMTPTEYRRMAGS